MEDTLPERCRIPPGDFADERLDGGRGRRERVGERRRVVAERALELARGSADAVEIVRRGELRRRAEHALELQCGGLGLLDALRLLRHPQLGELPAELLEV